MQDIYIYTVSLMCIIHIDAGFQGYSSFEMLKSPINHQSHPQKWKLMWTSGYLPPSNFTILFLWQQCDLLKVVVNNWGVDWRYVTRDNDQWPKQGNKAPLFISMGPNSKDCFDFNNHLKKQTSSRWWQLKYSFSPRNLGKMKYFSSGLKPPTR